MSAKKSTNVEASQLHEITIHVSPQAYTVLRQLQSIGLYGLTVEEVVGRIVDERLQHCLSLLRTK